MKARSNLSCCICIATWLLTLSANDLLAQPATSRPTHTRGPENATSPATTLGTNITGATGPITSQPSTGSDQIIFDQKFFKQTLNILAAVVVGCMGACAFYVGVLTGFIERMTREELLLHLNDDQSITPPMRRRLVRFLFYCFGGVVAGVFQWAQADTFAPIQAFVLGITWPSVVSRSMTSVSPSPSLAGLAARPGTIAPRGGPSDPAPINTGGRGPEIVIGSPK